MADTNRSQALEQTDQNDSVQYRDGNVVLPDAEWMRDADFIKDGMDLILELPDGRSMVVEGYFTNEPRLDLVLDEGSGRLNSALVESFLITGQDSANIGLDGQPEIGFVDALLGKVTVTRITGEKLEAGAGFTLLEGDIIETTQEGSVKIVFLDDTVFSLGENARMAMDKMVYNPETETGETALSILKGGFLFISGKIAKTDPDDMTVTTPVATIGIRGTVVAGTVDPEAGFDFSVVDGAIAVAGSGAEPVVLSDAFATISGQFNFNGEILTNTAISTPDEVIGRNVAQFSVLSASDVATIQTAVRASAAENGETTNLDLQASINKAVAAQEEANAGEESEVLASTTEAPAVAPITLTDVEIDTTPEPAITIAPGNGDGDGDGDGDVKRIEPIVIETSPPIPPTPDIYYYTTNSVDETIESITYTSIYDSSNTFNLSDSDKAISLRDTNAAETIVTGDHDDLIISTGIGGDVVNSGGGNDVITVSSGSTSSKTNVYAGNGNDTVIIAASSVLDTVDLEAGNDILNIELSDHELSDDVVTVFFSGGISGGEGADSITLSGNNEDVLDNASGINLLGNIDGFETITLQNAGVSFSITDTDGSLTDDSLDDNLDNWDVKFLSSSIAFHGDELLIDESLTIEKLTGESVLNLFSVGSNYKFTMLDSAVLNLDLKASIDENTAADLGNLSNIMNLRDSTNILDGNLNIMLDADITNSLGATEQTIMHFNTTSEDSTTGMFDEVIIDYDHGGNTALDGSIYIPLYNQIGGTLSIAQIATDDVVYDTQINDGTSSSEATLGSAGKAVYIGADEVADTLTLESGANLAYMDGGTGAGDDTLVLNDALIFSNDGDSATGDIESYQVNNIEILDLTALLTADDVNQVLGSLNADIVDALAETNSLTVKVNTSDSTFSDTLASGGWEQTSPNTDVDTGTNYTIYSADSNGDGTSDIDLKLLVA